MGNREQTLRNRNPACRGGHSFPASVPRPWRAGSGRGFLRAGGIGWGERADIDAGNFNTLQPTLPRLRPIFSDYGNVQFMHCETGGRYEGPATASVDCQYAGPAGDCGSAHPVWRRARHVQV